MNNSEQNMKTVAGIFNVAPTVRTSSNHDSGATGYYIGGGLIAIAEAIKYAADVLANSKKDLR